MAVSSRAKVIALGVSIACVSASLALIRSQSGQPGATAADASASPTTTSSSTATSTQTAPSNPSSAAPSPEASTTTGTGESAAKVAAKGTRPEDSPTDGSPITMLGGHTLPADLKKLKPGETPPQFVVFSWDGGATPELQDRFRKVMAKYDGHMTVFLTGIYFLSNQRREMYRPPGRKPGASAISYARTDERVKLISEAIFETYRQGHEIGTHFNGHFCNAGGVKSWTPAMWDDEVTQAIDLVKNYKVNNEMPDQPDAPFDYAKELQGARTPCLEGQKNFVQIAAKRNWLYDSSGTGERVWPQKFPDTNLWDIPLQFMPFGNGRRVLSMDYNYMVNQNGARGTIVKEPQPQYRDQMVDSLMAGFKETYESNRAPIIIGNHFNEWNGGAYMDAVEEVMHRTGKMDDVRLISFKELVYWLELQDPDVLKKLQALKVGETPPGGWESYLR